MKNGALIDADLRLFTGPGPQHSGDSPYAYAGTQDCGCTEGVCHYLYNCRIGLKPFDAGYINTGKLDEPLPPTRCDRCGEQVATRVGKIQCDTCGYYQDREDG